MTQDIRDLRPRGRLLENVDILRGTARHETDEQQWSWADWMIKRIYDGCTSKDVLAEMERAA